MKYTYPLLKTVLGAICFVTAILPGFVALGWLGFGAWPFALLFLVILVGLLRVGRILIQQRNSRTSMLTWAMVLVTMMACLYPSAILFNGMTHFRNSIPRCITNLEHIREAKRYWASEEEKSTSDTPTWEDIREFLNGPTIPVCPNGGTYILGKVGESPTCSIGGPRHSLDYHSGFPLDLAASLCLIFLSIGLQLIVAFRKDDALSPSMSATP